MLPRSPLLGRDVFGGDGAEGETVLVAALLPLLLRVLPERNLRQDLARRGTCCLGVEHAGVAELHPPCGAGGAVLRDPCGAHRRGRAAASQTVAEARQLIIKVEFVVLAGRQDEAGDVLGGEVHGSSGEAWGKQQAGICWPCVALLETGNSAQTSVKQWSWRFPAKTDRMVANWLINSN